MREKDVFERVLVVEEDVGMDDAQRKPVSYIDRLIGINGAHNEENDQDEAIQDDWMEEEDDEEILVEE